MAGRGTDIILGGDAKQSVLAKFLEQWQPYLAPSGQILWEPASHSQAAVMTNALHGGDGQTLINLHEDMCVSEQYSLLCRADRAGCL